MEDRDALLRHYRGTREGLLAAIHGLTDAQMTDPSIDAGRSRTTWRTSRCGPTCAPAR